MPRVKISSTEEKKPKKSALKKNLTADLLNETKINTVVDDFLISEYTGNIEIINTHPEKKAVHELNLLINQLIGSQEDVKINGLKIQVTQTGINKDIFNSYQPFKKPLNNLRPVNELPKVSTNKKNNHILFSQPPSLIKKSWFWRKQLQIKPKKEANENHQTNEIKNISDYEPWWLNLKLALNFFLVALLLIAPIKGFFIYENLSQTKGKVLGAAEEAFSKWGSAMQAASANNWLSAGSNFNQAENYFSKANANLSQINSAFIELAKNLPVGGKKLNQSEDLIKAGELISSTAANFSELMVNLKNPYLQEQPFTPNQVKKQVANISGNLNESLLILSGISANIIPEKMRQQFLDLHKNLPEIITNLNQAQELFNFTYDLLGYNGSQRYLFIFQNNNELRSTGGFMGSFALVDVLNGKITKMEVPGGGFYDLKGDFFQKIVAPKPFHILGTSWQIWNANWEPDFPASAKKIIWFFEKSGWPTPDGVITVNATVLPEILKLTGNISLSEYNQIFTPENVIAKLQEETEFNYNKTENKPKKVIGDLLKKVTEKLFNSSTEQYLPLFLSLNNSMANKDLQFYFQNDSQQKLAKNYGLTGEMLYPKTGDYLRIDRTNIAGGKTDLFIKQQVKHYTSIKEDGSIEDTVSIALTHQGELNDIFTKAQNNSYLRVYVPKGSKLLAASGYDVIPIDLFKKVMEGYMPDKDLTSIEQNYSFNEANNTDVYEAFDKTVFGNWLQIKPGETKTLTFSYILPFKISWQQNWYQKILNKINLKQPTIDYLFTLQNQSGVKNQEFESHLTLPQSMQIYWPKENQDNLKITNHTATFIPQTNLDQSYGLIIVPK